MDLIKKITSLRSLSNNEVLSKNGHFLCYSKDFYFQDQVFVTVVRALFSFLIFYVKNAGGASTHDEWKVKIQAAVDSMNSDQDLINKSIDNFVKRVDCYYRARGGLFEMKLHKN